MSIDQEIARLLSEVADLKSELSDIQERRQSLELRNKKALNKIYDRVDELDSWATFIHSLEDLPGTREPKWYRVSIPFDFGDSQERFSQVQISATGPFVCTQMQAYYKVTDTNATHYPAERNSNRDVIDPVVQQYTANGRMIPATSFFGMQNKMINDVFGPFAGEFNGCYGGIFSSYDPPFFPLQRGDGWNYPEFDLRIQTASNESFWTGTKSIPMAAVFGTTEPLYVARPSIVKSTDSLLVYAKPSIPTVNLKGSVEFVFHGYQINAHLNLEQLGV